MKNQMHPNALAFNKSSLVELNTQQLRDTDSGITPYILLSSEGCVIVTIAILDRIF